ncbi:glycoside hydrolase family 73 protein [Liquorilactobacillus nagelii]|jgi:lysozyme|uniref:glycoside hydrolase family 73 protein n=1 Tax=Liquorilactobacillus nagelii TaxID=82688 RepID=UPI00242B6665|nr:glycoside hydrolase family 73 protein [Liquorilactobacillus nagelii]MCI1700304.1 glycoside hydrolase family 73 protein [Liquorilactobacillus nagelii]
MTVRKKRQPKRKIKRRSTKTNFWFEHGHLRFSSLLFFLLLGGLIFLLSLGLIGRWAVNTPTVSQISDQQKRQFIEKILPAAQQQQRENHILTSITLAQAALESDWGQSELASKYHNLFGIKNTQSSAKLLTTGEYVNGQWITVTARFAVYQNWNESIAAHSKLFTNGTDWDRQHYQAVLAAKNYQQAAQALQQHGYATDPSYAQKLIELIQEYQLNKYDQ